MFFLPNLRLGRNQTCKILSLFITLNFSIELVRISQNITLGALHGMLFLLSWQKNIVFVYWLYRKLDAYFVFVMADGVDFFLMNMFIRSWFIVRESPSVYSSMGMFIFYTKMTTYRDTLYKTYTSITLKVSKTLKKLLAKRKMIVLENFSTM